MGDVIKTVKICGLTPHGQSFRSGACKRMRALVDTGASSTVISSKLAREIGAANVPSQTMIESRRVERCLASIELEAPGCSQKPVLPVVSDELVSRAGNGLQIILGHDYLQADRAALRYHGTEAQVQSDVACEVGSLKPARRGRPR